MVLYQTWCSTSRITTLLQSVSEIPKFRCTSADFFVIVPVRLAWFWVSNYLSHIVGAFLAVGLLQLRGVGGLAGWRYLFLIEGCMTLLVGLLSFIMMPPGPTQTKAWYRPNGWFSERYLLSIWDNNSHLTPHREEIIMVNRYDTVYHLHNVTPLTSIYF